MDRLRHPQNKKRRAVVAITDMNSNEPGLRTTMKSASGRAMKPPVSSHFHARQSPMRIIGIEVNCSASIRDSGENSPGAGDVKPIRPANSLKNK
jgi:hypothetical protein